MSGGKQAFREDQFDAQHGDPLADDSHADFDWELLYEALGEGRQLNDDSKAALCSALRILLLWQLNGVGDSKTADRDVGRKAIALAWVIDPSLIDGSPSLSGIARDLGCHKVVLSIHSAAARREFGLRGSRACAHAWNFGKRKQPAK